MTLRVIVVNSRVQRVRCTSIKHPNEASSLPHCDSTERLQGRIAVGSYPFNAETAEKDIGCLNPCDRKFTGTTFQRTYRLRNIFSIFFPWWLVTFTALLSGIGRDGKLLVGRQEEEESLTLAEARR